MYLECGRRGGGDFTSNVRVLLPSQLETQYRCMKLPDTDNDDSTHKNDTNTLSREAIQVTCFAISKTLC